LARRETENAGKELGNQEIRISGEKEMTTEWREKKNEWEKEILRLMVREEKIEMERV
jgi:hypothetical protein